MRDIAIYVFLVSLRLMATSRQDWTPRARSNFDFRSLDLIPEEGFVFSRIDGATPVRQLPFLTGLAKERVEGILDRLVTLGAVVGPNPAASADATEATDPSERLPEEPGEAGNWCRYYQQELRALSEECRIELAHSCHGFQLRALCFDLSPRVVVALLENPGFGLEHARLIARHHRSSQGLVALSQQLTFLRDRQVVNELLRNPQTPDILLQRIFLSKNLSELYGLAVGRNATERARNSSKQSFRKGFFRASAIERANLIFKTEGRCLIMLSGIPLDGRTAAMLCRRPFSSPLLVRNLARWPSTSPLVLQHLIRQAIVKRSVDLRNQILRHPNAPSRLST